MTDTEIVFADRYGPAGPPSLRVGCRGECEATGFVPVKASDDDPTFRDLWYRAEAIEPTDDGWHFVICPACDGTGRTRGLVARARQFVWWVGKKWQFARHHILVRPYTASNVHRAAYADRTDVPRPWLHNRRLALQVLTGTTRHQRAQRRARKANR